MAQGICLLALFLAMSPVRGIASPDIIGSDISIIINNDLLEFESPNSESGVLLLDAMNFNDAERSCEALGESLWGISGSIVDIKSNLDYLVYEGRYPQKQRYWISPNDRKKPRAIDSSGSIASIAAREQLPVLCTQTAPYSNETFLDTSSKVQITVSSNNEHIAGFRDRVSFRFLGVRYAEQPRRWTYSEPYTGSGNNVSALDYGSVCVQGPTTGSEDCLFLNIWTPYLPHHGRRSKSLKPVMFWIHGGAFTGGESSDPTFDGGNLASRGDVVVVAINYRLGNLGFLALGDGKTNGNFGLADQITALDWVRKNIKDFGGNPEAITIFGQSAGAGSVRALLASPRARGKFAGAIMQSNLGGLAYGTTYSKYYTIAEELDVAGNAILEETNCTRAVSQVDCLRKLPAGTIAGLGTTARYLVVDGEYLTTPELNLKNRKATANVPLMIGLMRDDSAAMIGYPRTGESQATFLNESGIPPSLVSPDDLFPMPDGPNSTLNLFNVTSRVATDGIFRCIDEATAYAGSINHIFPDVYFYEFNRSYQMAGYSPNPPLCEAPRTAELPAGDPSKEYFKCHSGELFYVFGNLRRQGLALRDEFDLPFSQFVLDSWASFARTGNPSPDEELLAARGYSNTKAGMMASGAWKPFSPGSYELMRLQWPGDVAPLEELKQCQALGLPLDYYL
ncbi:Alpha/Beta hydrolase protein [Aspergillus ambiguus]|uniref:Alpha/Beta hydrolase protein n=1 Tax=Aspergillus ambiguus TaxID=176160 RepID=UPI003CCE3EF9